MPWLDSSADQNKGFKKCDGIVPTMPAAINLAMVANDKQGILGEI